MGIDVCLYRARIGRFVACRKPQSGHKERFSAGSALISAICPRSSVLVLSSCLALLLLCAGDVERNPGPKIDDVLVLMKEFHEQTTSSLNEIKQDITNLKEQMNSIGLSIGGVPLIKDKFDAVNESVKEVKMTIAKTTEDLAHVVDDMNNRMRRNNLIVKGIPEKPKEDYAESEKIVKEFLSHHLKIKVGNIERAHRLGKKRPNFERPIIVKFQDFKSKTEALSNAFKLKDLETPKVWLEEDFSPKIQLARRKLREFAINTRDEGERYKIRVGTLELKGCIYRYDSHTDSIIQVSVSNPQALAESPETAK